jgi:hypothetical protein
MYSHVKMPRSSPEGQGVKLSGKLAFIEEAERESGEKAY